MDTLTIATWNVNSLRARMAHVEAWLQANPVDVLALQETKMTDDLFPTEAFLAMGYESVFVGQKSYNGVAVLSRRGFASRGVKVLPHAPEAQKRFLSVNVAGIQVVCVYVPNGSEVGCDKYHYKMAWLHALQAWVEAFLKQDMPLVLLGDFNIAPFDHDTHDPAVWQGKVLASDAERQHYQDLLALGMVDIGHHMAPDAVDQFSWWDYRAGAFRRNQGCRIDLLLANTALAQQCLRYHIDTTPRSWDKPSDHTPVVATFAAPPKEMVPASHISSS